MKKWKLNVLVSQPCENYAEIIVEAPDSLDRMDVQQFVEEAISSEWDEIGDIDCWTGWDQRFDEDVESVSVDTEQYDGAETPTLRINDDHEVIYREPGLSSN